MSLTNISTIPAEENVELCYLGDRSKCQTITIISKTVASLGLIGCLFILFMIYLFKKYNCYYHRLLLYLTVSGLFHSISYIINDLQDHKNATCKFQGWMLLYFDWTVLLWVCCLTFNLFLNATLMKPTPSHYEWKYHAVAWGAPFVISGMPLVGNTYGPAGIWCWVIDSAAWRFGVWYGPLFLLLVIFFVVYPYIFWKVHKITKQAEGDIDIQRSMIVDMGDVKIFMAYPIIYFLVSIMPLVNRIQNTISNEPVFTLVIFHAIFSPLMGSLNAIAYSLLDDETRQNLMPAQLILTVKRCFLKDDNLMANEVQQHVSDYKFKIINF